MSARSYAPGERVYGAIDDCPGCVISVDAEFDTFTVQWDGNDFPVVYDAATIMVRRPWPWES